MGASSNFRRSRSSLAQWTPANSRDFTANYIEVPHLGLHLPSESVTVEFWANFSALRQNYTFANASVGDAKNRFSSHAPWENGFFYWQHGDLTKNNSKAGLDVEVNYLLNQWTHFELTISQAEQARAVLSKGERLAYLPGYENYVATDESFFIGGLPGGGLNYPGRLGELRIWDSARTYNQIQSTSDVLLDSPQPGLLACWRLDDNVPVGGQILDRSGNNFHGILR